MHDIDPDDDMFSLKPPVRVELNPDGGAVLERLPTVPLTRRAMARDIAEEMGPEADPMRYMLGVIKDPLLNTSTRLDAAKAAAHFLYPKLAATAVTGSVTLEDLLSELPEPEN